MLTRADDIILTAVLNKYINTTEDSCVVTSLAAYHNVQYTQQEAKVTLHPRRTKGQILQIGAGDRICAWTSTGSSAH